MKNAILIHGTCDEAEYYNDAFPSLSNSHWFPWIQKQLITNEIETQTPEMPKAYLPDYQTWKSEFERYSIDTQTILVGHSCGGGFLVRWLSDEQVKVNTVILVAPWLDPFKEKENNFFDFTIDSKLVSLTDKLLIMVSRDDDKDVLISVEKLLERIKNIQIHWFENKGHFCFQDLGTNEFPELLREIVTN